jgi:hypothetical protein
MTSTLLRLVAFVLFAAQAQAQTPSQLTITVSEAPLAVQRPSQT